tara:strand:+ start:139 stop:588 length:450 start_codon:yes stop_codon:yes gene_type:complete
MRNQIEKYRGQGISSDTQRRKLARDLQEKLEKTSKQTEEYETRYQTATRTITQLKNGIHQIFTRIGAASASVDEMLGNQGVTETNMLQYLGIIEQRTSEILQQFAATQMGAGKPKKRLKGLLLCTGGVLFHMGRCFRHLCFFYLTLQYQ